MKIRRSPQKSICLYISVHEPYDLQKMTFFDIGEGKPYFSKEINKNYTAVSQTLQNVIDKNPDFKFALSISGVFLDQCSDFDPKIIRGFKELIETGNVELIAETFYHSLSWLFSKKEFSEQIKLQMRSFYIHFRKKPKIFKNTELIYNNELSQFIKLMGFTGILADGVDTMLHGRSPNHIFTPVKSGISAADRKIALDNKIYSSQAPVFKVLLKNYSQSKNILNIDPFEMAEFIDDEPGETINIFLDYDEFTKGKEPHEIYEYLLKFSVRLKEYKIAFRTPTQTLEFFNEKYELDQHNLISWSDVNRDLTLWTGSEIQNGALSAIYELEDIIKHRLKKKSEKKEAEEILLSWRKLQSSDYFKNMSTATSNSHELAYNAYINYMNILNDLMTRI